MIQVSEDFKNAFLSGHQKNLTLTFDDGTVLTNSDIVYESFEIDQAICREQEMTFGVCASSCMKVDIFYTPKSYVGLWCEPAISTEMNGRIYSMTLGKYKIDENPVSDNHNVRTLVGYDSLYDVLNTNYADWYKNLALPMTLKNIRNSFFNHIGITQVSVSLPNDNVVVEKTIEADTLSGSEILQRIMEINAAFGFINYEGKFKYLTYEDGFGLYPAPDLYPQREGLYPVKLEIGDFSFDNADGVYVLDTLKYEDYVTSGITGVKIRQDDEDGGVIVGTDTNLYMITGNFFLFGKEGAELTQIANRFMDYVDYMEYLPAQFSARAHIWIEPGDIVSVQGRTTMVMFPVFERTLNGITALYDEYRALGSEYYTDNANNTTNMIQNLKSKTLRIRQDIDEVSSELTETEENLENNYYTKTQTGTIIEQTVEKIEIAYTQAISNAKDEVEEYTDNKITIDNSGVHLKAEKGSGASSSEVTLDLDVTYKPGTQEREAKLKVTADNISMTAQQTIDLMSGGTINLTSENMNIQSNNFSVTSQGAVTASSLTLTGGSIDIQNNQSGARKREFKVNSDGTIEVHLANLDIDTNGSMTADSLTLTGGSIAIGDSFSVQEDGTMTANNMNLTATAEDGRGINIQGGRILFFDRLPVAPKEDSYIGGHSSGITIFTGGQQTAYFSESGLNVNRGILNAPKIVAFSVTDTGNYVNDGGFWEGNSSVGWERLATRKWVSEHSATIPKNTNQVVYDLSQQDSAGAYPLVRIGPSGLSKYFIYTDNIKYSRYTYSSVADPDDYGDLIPFYGIDKNPFMGATPKFVHAYAQPKGQSDERLKENIQLIDNRYEDFYMSLNPVTFNFHANLAEEKYERDRKRIGLIAQEVEKSLYDNGLDNTQFVYRMNNNSQSKYYPYTGDSVYILEYQDFHALHIHMIQKHENEIKELKQEIADLKEMVGDLVSIIKEEK